MSMITRRSFLQGSGALIGGCALAGVIGMDNALGAWIPEPTISGFVPVKGGKIWYRMNGTQHFPAAKIALIVIHGGPGFSHHYLLPLVDLAEDRPVILYDQLDSGNSSRPNDPANWTVERFVSEIGNLREALGLDRLLVFGNSWGGTIAAEYAISQPAGLVAVVLSSPLISTKRWLSDNREYRNQLPDDVRKALDKNEAAGTIHSQEYMDAVMVFYKRHLNRMDPWPDEVNRSFEVFNEDLYVTMWGNTEFNATGTLKDYDAMDRLGRIQVPVLYTCGEYDECTPGAARDFAGLTPKAKVEVIANASHTAFLEQRKQYMEVVRKFYAQFD